jgi:hypothetical protein
VKKQTKGRNKEMSQLREAVFRRKEKLIKKLLELGVYKKDEHHLYELTLSEIETEYHNEIKRKKSIG